MTHKVVRFDFSDLACPAEVALRCWPLPDVLLEPCYSQTLVMSEPPIGSSETGEQLDLEGWRKKLEDERIEKYLSDLNKVGGSQAASLS